MWIEEIQADVISLEYGFDTRVARLVTKEHNPPDMGGCRRYVEQRFPDVERIEVLIGPNGSTGKSIYKRGPGGWDAVHA